MTEVVAIVYSKQSNVLSAKAAYKIIQTADESKITTVAPHMPSGSDIYVYQSVDPEAEGDWTSDGCRWIHDGTDRLPRKQPVIYKRKFRAWTADRDGSLKFRKLVFSLLDDKKNCRRKLIQYIGDEENADSGPHGNAKGNKDYLRTAPSTFERIRKTLEESPSTAPNVIYKNEIGCAAGANPGQPSVPRNRKQAENIKTMMTEKRRLSKDTLANLLDIAHDMPAFVWKVIVVPNLAAVCGRREILEEMDSVLTLSSCCGQLLSYDTTFQCGDFYVSVFLFRHVLFKQNPCVPAMFLVHERKLAETHEELIMTLTKKVQSFSVSNAPIVTNKEFGIGTALTRRARNLNHVLCLVHIIRDLRLWIKKHGGSNSDCRVYIAGCSVDFTSYRTRLLELQPGWSKPYLQYYENNIEPFVDAQLGRWVLEPLGVYNAYSGVTQNQAEGFNAVLKRFQEWKEAAIDMFCLSVYKLQGYYINEIRRGINGCGEYTLKSEFGAMSGTCDNPLLQTEAPDEIVQKMKERHAEPHVESVEESSKTTHDNIEPHTPATAFPS